MSPHRHLSVTLVVKVYRQTPQLRNHRITSYPAPNHVTFITRNPLTQCSPITSISRPSQQKPESKSLVSQSSQQPNEHPPALKSKLKSNPPLLLPQGLIRIR